jgi:hypothetical protein
MERRLESFAQDPEYQQAGTEIAKIARGFLDLRPVAEVWGRARRVRGTVPLRSRRGGRRLRSRPQIRDGRHSTNRRTVTNPD